MNKSTLTLLFIITGLLILTVIPPVLAFEWESQVKSFFDGTTGFLVKTVGSGVFVIGLVVAGIKIAGGDQGGLRNAVLVMIGGAVIFLAKPLVEILANIAKSTAQ